MSQVFGSSVKRREDPRLIQGYGHYTEDMVVPKMASVVFLRSPYAHAKIKSLNTEKAKAQPGVIAVFTGKDTESKLAADPNCLGSDRSRSQDNKVPSHCS